jgi:pyruvate kinase
MRLGPIPGDLVECPLDAEFSLAMDRSSDNPRELTCTYRELPNDLKPGEAILFADGTVAMTVIDVVPGRARLRVTLPGRLRSKQGLNLPGADLAVKSLTDKDLHDLDWTARQGDDVQFVGLSFARSPDDVARLRSELAARKCGAKIVVKIEKPQAVRELEAIVAATDGVMVARGDLGVEMDVQRVPAIQKTIIALCNRTHRPVITATQMLNSMEHSSRPTRAEASDVFNAVLDGTDAVMLSGESAIGAYPVLAVTTMRLICAEAEGFIKASRRPADLVAACLSGFVDLTTEAMVDAACLAATRLDAPLIVVATNSGRTAFSAEQSPARCGGSGPYANGAGRPCPGLVLGCDPGRGAGAIATGARDPIRGRLGTRAKARTVGPTGRAVAGRNAGPGRTSGRSRGNGAVGRRAGINASLTAPWDVRRAGKTKTVLRLRRCDSVGGRASRESCVA